jgi:galactokinase
MPAPDSSAGDRESRSDACLADADRAGREDLLRAWNAEWPGAGVPRVFFAPGRVNLMGAHLDYNGGPVMPTTIDRGTYLAVRPRTDGVVRLASLVEHGRAELDVARLPKRPLGVWHDYPVGVLRALAERLPTGTGFDLLYSGNLPIGAGLSSSASICVVTALALSQTLDLGLAPEDWVDVALQAERGFVGVQCGIMDPFAVGCSRPGHLLWLDCLDRSYEHVPLDAGRVAVATADTGVRRELAGGTFNQRVSECEQLCQTLAPGARFLRELDPDLFWSREGELPAALAARGRHVFSELGRAFSARDALRSGDVESFGRLMTESHASLRRDFEVSIEELDALVDLAAEVPGFLGSRLTGAGFGGCTVILLERGAEDDLRRALEAGYQERFGRKPTVRTFAGDPGPREL